MNINEIVINNWVIVIILSVIFALFIYKFIFFLTFITSYSMYPTIKPKDRIITKRIYKYKKIRRGDILVFYSNELEQMMIKRVIGLPNDCIEIEKNGTINVNGVNYDEPYVKCSSTFNGRYKISEKKYLFLGDNRKYSLDSRFWEEPLILEKNIKGKAVFRIFPFNRIGKLN